MLSDSPNILPELSTSQVNDILDFIPHYKGCFPNDYVRRHKPDRLEYLVLNLQNSNQGGSHWVAIVNRPDCKNIEYYDSFGLPPTEDVAKYMLKSGKTVLYNSNQVQGINSSACGFFASYFIIQRSYNISPYEVVYHFDLNDMDYNEYSLAKYFGYTR